MKRWLLFIGLLFVSTLAYAADATDFYKLFQPAPEDLSVWYLGNIFGSDLVPGEGISGVRLLSVLFGIFNQIALSVAIIIIVYTALAGTLNTANEGKPLGEKWNSMWMPVRISVGIALLVPKGGTGYCLAQSLIMWLTLQGVGAADTVWNAMVEYFAQGGAIYSNQSAQTSNYMTPGNIQYAYALQGLPSGSLSSTPAIPEARLLDNMVCIALFNSDKDAVELNGGKKYEVYTKSGVPNSVFFGDRTAGTTEGVNGGSECGRVVSIPFEEDCIDQECINTRAQIYTNANWNMAKGLTGLAQAIVDDPEDEEDKWSNYNETVNRNAELYINYLVGYENILFDRAAASVGLNEANAFKVYKKYGWILAGNYYTVLSAYKERVDFVMRYFRPAQSVTSDFEPGDDNAYLGVVDYADYVWAIGLPKGLKADAAQSTRGDGSNKRKIGPVDMNEIYKSLGGNMGQSDDKKSAKITKKEAKEQGMTNKERKKANKNARKQAKAEKKLANYNKKANASSATRSAVEDFIKYLTGEGSGVGDLRVAKDPILTAAKYGKSLTQAAVVLMPIIAGLMTAIAIAQVCKAVSNVGAIFATVGWLILPQLLALMVFMYTQGAILGVFIPLIPYVTFFIGVVGWLLQVVEAVAAAPLVAIGLVFPETRDDIWGRAAPAYMMVLGLFLRPALMLVGLAAAMMVLWVLTELLNIGFLMLTTVTFRIEELFGFVVILMAYTAIFTVVVTKAYSLINVVPNKVLSWIGDNSMGVAGAEEAISAAKGGVESGAGAVSGGASKQGDTYRAAGAAEKTDAGKAAQTASTKAPSGPGDKAGGSTSPDPKTGAGQAAINSQKKD